jgi:hypothetical protein
MPSLDELLTGYGRFRQGTPEAALTIGTGALADIPAGLGGLWEFGKEKVKGKSGHDAAMKAAERVEQLREKFTYQPRTEAGKEALGTIGKGIEWGGEQLKKLPGAKQAQADWEKATIEAPGITAAMAGLAAVAEPKGVRAAKRGAKAAGAAADVAKTAERAAQVAPAAAPVDLRATVVREPVNDEIARLQDRMKVLIDGGVSKRSPTVVKVRREIEQLQKQAGAADVPPQAFDVPKGKIVTPEGLVDDPAIAEKEARAAKRAQRATELAAEAAAAAEKRAVREAEVGREATQLRSQFGATDYDYGPQSVPNVVLDMGASKAARDRAAAGRVADEAERQAAATGEDVERVARSAEERAAVDPDKYRKLYKEQGEQAVFDAAERGEHLRRGPDGELIGAPRDVRTDADLERMRKGLDDQLTGARMAISFAEDPKRVGNWYERAQQGILETTEPKLLDRTLDAQALHSQGVDPIAQAQFANRYLQSRGLGVPQTGFYGRQAKLLDEARARGENAKLAFKVGEYRKKLDAREDQLSPSGVNDFRAAQTYGYTDTYGQPWSAGVSPQMHPFMDAENALTVLRSRAMGVPGMTGALVQELPWVLGKSEDLLLRGLHKGDTPLDTRRNVIREANKTQADADFDLAGAATLGTEPGLDTGIAREIGSPKWTRAANEADPHERDILLSATDQRHYPPTMATGEWKGATEPNVVNRPLLYSHAKSTDIAPEQLAAMKALEAHRGLAGGQTAVAMNFPDTKGSGLTDVLLERKGMNRYGNPTAHMPTPDEMVALNKELTGHGYFAVPSQRGALLKQDPSAFERTPEAYKKAQKFGPPAPAKPDEMLRALKKNVGLERLEALMPGARAEAALDKGFYLPVTPSRAEMGKGVGTSRWLEAMRDAPEAVAEKVGKSKEARDALKTHIRAVEMAKKKGKDFPEPMMKTLEFMAGKDWPKVVKIAREKKVPIATAMGMMGLSLEGMAADDLERLKQEEKEYAK